MSTDIVEGVLGCSFKLSPDEEYQCYKELLSAAVGDDLTYSTLLAMENEITLFVDENSDSTEIPTLGKEKLYNMMDHIFSGLDYEFFDNLYDKTIGRNIVLRAVNLIKPKMSLEIPGIMITAKNSYTGEISIDSEHHMIKINIGHADVNMNDIQIH